MMPREHRGKPEKDQKHKGLYSLCVSDIIFLNTSYSVNHSVLIYGRKKTVGVIFLTNRERNFRPLCLEMFIYMQTLSQLSLQTQKDNVNVIPTIKMITSKVTAKLWLLLCLQSLC